MPLLGMFYLKKKTFFFTFSRKFLQLEFGAISFLCIFQDFVSSQNAQNFQKLFLLNAYFHHAITSGGFIEQLNVIDFCC